MKIKLPNAVTLKAGRTALLVSKNSPHLLFGVGVVGVVGTVVLACRATLKLEDVLKDTQKDLVDVEINRVGRPYSAGSVKREQRIIKVRAAGKVAVLYAPAVVVGGLSIAALSQGHRIQSQRIAGLTAAYTALDKGFTEYRKRVTNEYGEEKERELYHGVSSETQREVLASGKVKETTTKKAGDGAPYSRIFGETNKHWVRNHEKNRYFLQCQQTFLNDRLNAYGHVFLNEAYDMLGFERTPEGVVVGWLWDKDSRSGDGFIDLGIFEPPNSDVRDFYAGKDGYVLDFNVDGTIWDKI